MPLFRLRAAALGVRLARAATVSVTLALLASLAVAQTFTVELGGVLGSSASGSAAPAFGVSLTGGRVGAATVDLAISYRDAAQLDFALSENRSFGPVGNVVFEFDAAVRTDSAAQAEVTARGAFGPVAMRLSLGAFSHDADRFDPLAGIADARPRFRDLAGSQSGYSLRLVGSGRLNRSLVFEADPELYLVEGSFAARTGARLRWLRAFGDNELRLLAHAYSPPSAAAGHVALGAGLVLGRGRAPDWTFAATLGYADGRLLPGASVELIERFASGQIVSLYAAAEPYRRDIAAYRAHGSFQASWGPGSMSVRAFGGDGGAFATPAYGLNVSYSLPVELR